MSDDWDDRQASLVHWQPWINFDVYRLVFREIEEGWVLCPAKEQPSIVLIGEYDAAEGAFCSGNLLRAWERAPNSVREIKLTDYQNRMRAASGRAFAFESIKIHVSSDHTKVVLNDRSGSLAGSGNAYLVVGQGESAELVIDPDVSGWIS